MPLLLMLLIGGMALLPEAGLLAASDNLSVLPLLVGIWTGGLVLLQLATRSQIGNAESIAIGGGGLVALLTLAAVLTGGEMVLGAVIVGGGYLLIFAFGYGIYRLTEQAWRQDIPAIRLNSFPLNVN